MSISHFCLSCPSPSRHNVTIKCSRFRHFCLSALVAFCKDPHVSCVRLMEATQDCSCSLREKKSSCVLHGKGERICTACQGIKDLLSRFSPGLVSPSGLLPPWMAAGFLLTPEHILGTVSNHEPGHPECGLPPFPVPAVSKSWNLSEEPNS